MKKLLAWLKKRYLLIVWKSRYFGGSENICNYYFSKREAMKDYNYYLKVRGVFVIRLSKRKLNGKYKKVKGT